MRVRSQAPVVTHSTTVTNDQGTFVQNQPGVSTLQLTNTTFKRTALPSWHPEKIASGQPQPLPQLSSVSKTITGDQSRHINHGTGPVEMSSGQTTNVTDQSKWPKTEPATPESPVPPCVGMETEVATAPHPLKKEKPCNSPLVKQEFSLKKSRKRKSAPFIPGAKVHLLPKLPPLPNLELPDLDADVSSGKKRKGTVSAPIVIDEDSLPDVDVKENIQNKSPGANNLSSDGRTNCVGPRTTLIVCPLSVLSNWIDQLEDHVDERVHLAINVFYGPSRCKSAQVLQQQDIVLTTYQTVTTDSKGKNILGKVKWLRVVLDEGHTIRNPNTQMTKAILGLQTQRKWVLTGDVWEQFLVYEYHQRKLHRV
ncbi:uncharacterized protein LOC106182092 [Lingula anatina]|uniref:Uncharacterized protein LOC106182092 n=1 Tax=Lingula anatina TaxID=7574 RepID=A0A1S3KI90_LINAN|nr:uncharacterized protein LOC106182092 [Lingula anatina]|eukprot:XP_013422194.2 uncharacterized protein LOC106182092 [Lingula anatina]